MRHADSHVFLKIDIRFPDTAFEDISTRTYPPGLHEVGMPGTQFSDTMYTFVLIMLITTVKYIR